jgi:Zn-dependent metalloprotease
MQSKDADQKTNSEVASAEQTSLPSETASFSQPAGSNTSNIDRVPKGSDEVATEQVQTNPDLEQVRNIFATTSQHKNGASLYVTFKPGATIKVNSAEEAKQVIKQAAADYLQLRKEDDIVTTRTKSDNLGNDYYTFQQTYKDVPVHGTLMVVRADVDQNMRLVSGRFEKNIELDTTPLLEGTKAVTAALQNLEQPPANEPAIIKQPSLQIHYNDFTAKASLVYRSVVEYYDTGSKLHVDEVLVDAHDGRIVDQQSRIFGAAHYYSGNSRYAYINSKKKSRSSKYSWKSFSSKKANSGKKRTRAHKSSTIALNAGYFVPRPPVQIPFAPPPIRRAPIIRGPVILPPPPIIMTPHLPPPNFPPVVTRPQLPPPNFPPVVTRPQLPPPNFPPVVTRPQLPPPNFPPVVTRPQLPPPNFPPVVTRPQLPPPNFPPVVTGPQFPQPTPGPVSNPPTSNGPNNGITREIYQLRAGLNCVGLQGVDINTVLPGQYLFGEEGPSNTASNSARGVYSNLGTTYWYFKYMHGRKSWDDQDRTITASIGAQFASPQGGCTPYNAQYMPQKGQIRDTDFISVQDQARYFPDKDQLIFGGDNNTRLVESLDLVAHEYGHGVTMHGSQIGSNAEGAAMNEAYSDVFAAGVEAWSRSGGSKDGNPDGGFDTNVVNSANTWELCESCGQGFPPRYLSDPAKGKSSLHKSVYYYGQVNWPTTSGDRGNPHANGGILTMAFYLTSVGGTHPEAGTNGVPRVQVDGIGMEKALKVFYAADAFTLGPKSKYQDARNLIADAAVSLREAELREQGLATTEACNPYYKAVNQAFDAVGVPGNWNHCN